MFRIYPGCEFFSRVLSDSRSPTFCRYFKIGGNDMARKTNVPILSNRAHSTPLAEMRWSLPSKRAAISPFIDQLSAFIRTLHSGPQSCCRSRGRHRNGSARGARECDSPRQSGKSAQAGLSHVLLHLGWRYLHYRT